MKTKFASNNYNVKIRLCLSLCVSKFQICEMKNIETQNGVLQTRKLRHSLSLTISFLQHHFILLIIVNLNRDIYELIFGYGN